MPKRTAPVLLALLAAPFAMPAGAAAAPLPVIISTDTATGLSNGWRAGASDIDDGLAIAMALAAPELDVLGVVVTWGNNLMEPEAAIARRVVAGMGAEVPVVRGAPRPLPEVPVTLYDGSAVNDACLNDGVRFMADALAKSAAPVAIAAIGPLTDVACLAQNFPDAAANIAEVVVIGGRDPHQAFAINDVYLSDFNLANDIPAVAWLLDKTTIPLRFMPFGLTSSVLVPAAERATLCASAQAARGEVLLSGDRPLAHPVEEHLRRRRLPPVGPERALFADRSGRLRLRARDRPACRLRQGPMRRPRPGRADATGERDIAALADARPCGDAGQNVQRLRRRRQGGRILQRRGSACAAPMPRTARRRSRR